MTCGIYKITNKVNGHAYVGLSNNIERRAKEHLSASKSPNEKVRESALYRAIRKYGKDNFSIEVLEELPNNRELLKKRECLWIKILDTYDGEGYNETPSGDSVGKNNVHYGEDHGMALLSHEEVMYCRQAYREGKRSRNVYEENFKEKISYSAFLAMWHGKNWKTVCPEVFNNNPHPAKYGEKDCEKIVSLFKNFSGSLRSFVSSEYCYVGYGTAWNMIHNPDFYIGK